MGNKTYPKRILKMANDRNRFPETLDDTEDLIQYLKESVEQIDDDLDDYEDGVGGPGHDEAWKKRATHAADCLERRISRLKRHRMTLLRASDLGAELARDLASDETMLAVIEQQANQIKSLEGQVIAITAMAKEILPRNGYIAVDHHAKIKRSLSKKVKLHCARFDAIRSHLREHNPDLWKELDAISQKAWAEAEAQIDAEAQAKGKEEEPAC